MRHLQFAYFDQRQTVTKNYRGEESLPRISEIVDIGFAGIHLSTDAEEVDIRTTKKGKHLIGRSKAAAAPQPPATHNRIKKVPLPEGQPDRILEALGIQMRDGQVRPTMCAKYTQINECLKLLTHVLDDAELRSLDREVEILDCGCGSSHLTLAVHHYLKEVLGVPARVLGVDINEEMIRKNVVLRPTSGRRASISLVAASTPWTRNPTSSCACTPATPPRTTRLCCQSRLQARILLKCPAATIISTTRYARKGLPRRCARCLRDGILRQRTADLVTDAFRALALRIMGYRTEVIEFISTEHTVRNLMIRAVRGAAVGEVGFVVSIWKCAGFGESPPTLRRCWANRFSSFSRRAASNEERRKV